MKNILAVLLLGIITFSTAQTYEFGGMVNNKPATVLLHFVTASDDESDSWSHGSFYFDDNPDKVAVIFQYKPEQPEAGELTFNMLNDEGIALDYIKGKLNKSSFKGTFSKDGKVSDFNLKAKREHNFIVYNYYKNKDYNGHKSKYFGKFISLDSKEASIKLTEFLSDTDKRRMPRPYLKDVYDNVVTPGMRKDADADYLVNYAIYPIISLKDRVVFQVVKNVHKDDKQLMNEMDRVQYNFKTGTVSKVN